tara:strand:- start:4156 stop:4572 length:417 start_codon:yes stop_codon:yes gene_type:complete
MRNPIKALEIMSQLNMEGGKEPSAKARSMANDKNLNPETAEKFRQDLEKAKAEIRKISEETKAKSESERPRTYTERLQDMGRLPKGGSGSAGSKIDLEKGMMGSGMPKPKLKAGGKVSSASKRADGCAVRGKTKGKMI